MQKFSSDCAVRFVKKPIRLNLKFEKSYTMAIKVGKNDVLSFFPSGSLRSCYVSMHQLKDYKDFKSEKVGGKNDQMKGARN